MICAYNYSAQNMKYWLMETLENSATEDFNDYLYAYALVAQLDRVSASEAECRVFKSPRAHHFF